MFTYHQNSGQMYDPNGMLLATGYSGAWDGTEPAGPHNPNDHRNKPTDVKLHKLGCIPKGKYRKQRAFTDPHLGPVTMHLIPDPTNKMFGRSLFRIHGDCPPPHSGQASKGCIILPHDIRVAINNNDDDDIIVV